MALTSSQLIVLRLLTESRRNGESYIAGGAALNQVLGTARKSDDLDLFHDTTEALQATWNSDRAVLGANGYAVDIIRETMSFVEADISREDDHVRIQWVRDSAFRFFPLIEDALLGLTLHPIDLATNKVLAMAGRLEPRDWVDTIECHCRIQQLGFLIWAACGKDPGINPHALVADAARLHYAQEELNALAFNGAPPAASALNRTWKDAVAEAKELIALLPDERFGECVLFRDGTVYNRSLPQFVEDVKTGNVRFHRGAIKGVWPQVAGGSE